MSIDASTAGLWKRELADRAASILSRYQAWDGTLQSEFEIEKEVFIGFYAVRKLMESGRAPTASNFNIKITEYPPLSGIDFEATFADKWQKAYRLIDGNSVNLSTKRLCDQFIHSKIYSPFVAGGVGVMGIFFASDAKYETGVYYIQLYRIAELFLCVGEDRQVCLALTTKGGRVQVSRVN